MSTKYKKSSEVPMEVICDRLDELAHAVSEGPDSIRREFGMRVPAELDFDADLVLSIAAVRLRELSGIKKKKREGMKPVDVFREYGKKLVTGNTLASQDSPEPLIDYEMFRVLYKKNHESCPKCEGVNVVKTIVEYLYVAGKASEYVDKNNAKCECGWIGIVHDLVKKKPELKEKILNASNVQKIQWDESNLIIHFTNGNVYQYFDIPEKISVGLSEAKSPGSYLHREIKGNYGYSRVD